MSTCNHENHAAQVGVFALTPTEGGPVTAYTADIRVSCASDCGLPFGFPGVPVGSSPRFPTTSPDATELRVPLLSPSALALRQPLEAMWADSLRALARGLAEEVCRRQGLLTPPKSCLDVPELKSAPCLSCRARALLSGSTEKPPADAEGG